ncbi:MAG: hypothetical protein JRD02_13315 [Deltaproteobacteria bacterium]|nr:hypothetical protein [Deltaproteobacteria bacterium]
MALPWYFVSKNTNSKHQNTNTMPKAGKNLKLQYPTRGASACAARDQTLPGQKTLFGFSNFGHWNLFDIWDLIFGISISQ